MAAILEEIRGLVDTGYQEIVLTGVNIGDFVDGENRLGDLVRAVDAIDGIKRLRLSSINPNEIDNVLFEALVTGRTTSHALHLVLQSGSNAVLQRMRRLYTREQYLAIVDRFVQRCPDWTISTDVIVGFPGETEEDFAATLDVIRTAKHIKVHMFPYSVRPRTLAARSIDRVSPATIKRRKHHLLEVADAVAFERRQSFVGQTMEVLVEDSGESGFVRGQTSNGLQVVLPQASVEPNTMVLVRLEQNSSCELIGTIIGSAS
jgi:threonylcarbamoyladenosine tRNA methylthiotransferase MtaB